MPVLTNEPNNIAPQEPDHLTPDELKKVVARLAVAVPIIGAIIALIILGLAAFFILNEQDIPGDENILPSDTESRVGSNSMSISPTSFPFQEMTIPHLRLRDYQSTMHTLTEYGAGQNYTSYLTSYDSDGYRVNGLITIPNNNAPEGGWPAIVFVHGYIPPSEYRTTEKYHDYVDYLARNGFVVFKIDLRGHGDSEGEAGGGYYSADYVIDVLNAKAALQNFESVNASRIGFWGHSMAGNVISRAMAASPDTPAISIWAGAVYTYSDFSEYQIEDSSYRPPPSDSEPRRERDELFEKYGRFDADSEFWSQVPMTNFLSEIKGAIQINHAVNDDVVDIGYSRNFASLLEKAGVEHELNEYASGGHNITGAAFNSAMENTVQWFRKYL